MYGAILGDIIGSPYEGDMGAKTKDFILFDKGCRFTDDTVMTIAVAEALMIANGRGLSRNEKALKDMIIDSMEYFVESDTKNLKARINMGAPTIFSGV